MSMRAEHRRGSLRPCADHVWRSCTARSNYDRLRLHGNVALATTSGWELPLHSSGYLPCSRDDAADGWFADAVKAVEILPVGVGTSVRAARACSLVAGRSELARMQLQRKRRLRRQTTGDEVPPPRWS